MHSNQRRVPDRVPPKSLVRQVLRAHAVVVVLALVMVTRAITLPAAPLRLAVLGDYGVGSVAEGQVAAMVKSWEPDAVLTTGDNNYPRGAATTIDGHIGQYYQEYIGNYQGTFGPGAVSNRFFPSLGNHDWLALDAQPYLDYFELPGQGLENSSGNERYYDYRLGDAHFFAYDSDPHEPDGVTEGSVQAEWLRTQLAASDATWKIVYFHHPPFSSGPHGSEANMQLPFQEWGADVVMTGHDHTYERVILDGFPYFVVGTGGAALYNFDEAICGSRSRYNEANGALRLTLDGDQALFEFLTIDDGMHGQAGGRLIDRFLLDRAHPAAEPIPGDTDQNGAADLVDLNAIRNSFGRLVGGDADHDCQTTLSDINWVRNNFSGDGPGDTNGDGVIDLVDLNAARNGLGSHTGGDLNRDGVIDLTDLNLLRNNFGQSAPVPESTALVLGLVSVAVMASGLCCKRRLIVKRSGRCVAHAMKRGQVAWTCPLNTCSCPSISGRRHC